MSMPHPSQRPPRGFPGAPPQLSQQQVAEPRMAGPPMPRTGLGLTELMGIIDTLTSTLRAQNAALAYYQDLLGLGFDADAMGLSQGLGGGMQGAGFQRGEPDAPDHG